MVGGELVVGIVGEPSTLQPTRRDPEPSRWLRQLDGKWEQVDQTPGLEVVYEPKAGADTKLDRLTVRFVQTLDTGLELLEAGELDVAVLPSAVNLLERLDERGLEGAATEPDEVVYLDLSGSDLDVPSRTALGALAERPSLDAAFVRELGDPTDSLHAASGRGPFRGLDARTGGEGRSIELAAPLGDELLAMMQRALHDDWEEHGFLVDILSVDARTFYGARARRPDVDAALRRGSGPGLPPDDEAYSSMDAIPLFRVPTVVAWRDGVQGIDAPAPGGPLRHTERWWVGDG